MISAIASKSFAFKIFLLLIFLASLNSRASNLTGFCFEKNTSLTQARKWLENIIDSDDEIILRSSINCLEVKHESSLKKDLYKKYLSQKFKLKKVYSSLKRPGQKKPRETCKIKLESLKKIRSNRSKSKIYRDDLRLSQNSRKAKKLSSSSLLLSQGKWGEFIYNQKKYKINCSLRGKFADIKIRSQTNQSSFESEFQLKKGVKTEISSHLENNNNKNKKIETKGFKSSKNRLQKKFKMYIKIN